MKIWGGHLHIWVSWLWLFGTPFYWLIALIIRRMRCLTMADFYEERFGKTPSILHIFIASTGMIICLASVLLATSRTAQGLIGRAAVVAGVPASDLRLCDRGFPGTPYSIRFRDT